MINDFTRTNARFCAIAYPILEDAGVPAGTRLREKGVNGAEQANGTRPRNA